MKHFQPYAFALLVCLQGTVSVAQSDADLREQLESGDAEKQFAAMQTIAEFGPQGAGFVGTLSDIAGDKSASLALRQEAIATLGRIGNKAALSIPGLISIVSDQQAETLLRSTAIDSIRQINPPLTPVRNVLQMSLADDELRFPAAWALVSLDAETAKDVSVMDTLIGALADPKSSPSRRREAGLALAIAGKVAVPRLVELLKQDDARVQGAAARSLAAMGPLAKDAVASLNGLLDGKAAAPAMRALGEIGVSSESTWEKLEAALAGDDQELQAAAAESAGNFAQSGSVPEGVLSRLATALQSDSPGAVASAATALEQAGSDALPLLTEQLDNSETRALAAAVIGQIGERTDGNSPAVNAAIAKLSSLLEAQQRGDNGKMSADLASQSEALQALASFGPTAQKAVPGLAQKLEERLADKSYPNRAAAAVALARVAKEKSIAALTAASKDTDAPLLQAVGALGLLNAAPNNPRVLREAMPRLLAMLQDADFEKLRPQIMRGIQQMGSAASSLISDANVKGIADMLRSDDPALRLSAVELLGGMAKDARFLRKGIIMAALKVATRDSDRAVRATAVRAFEQNR